MIMQVLISMSVHHLKSGQFHDASAHPYDFGGDWFWNLEVGLLSPASASPLANANGLLDPLDSDSLKLLSG